METLKFGGCGPVTMGTQAGFDREQACITRAWSQVDLLGTVPLCIPLFSLLLPQRRVPWDPGCLRLVTASIDLSSFSFRHSGASLEPTKAVNER